MKSSFFFLFFFAVCGHSGRNNKPLPPSSLFAGSLMTKGGYVVSTYLIYITCIMYFIWDISFSELAVLPNTHRDQHNFWVCNNQRNVAVMWEQEEITWHYDVPIIVLLSSFLTSLLSFGASQKGHEFNRVKHGTRCKSNASVSKLHIQRKRENIDYTEDKLPWKLCGSMHMLM